MGLANGIAISPTFIGNNIPSSPLSQNLTLWMDAEQITGYANGDLLPSWSDSSGSSVIFSQSEAVRQPTYETNALNGKPGVRFVNDLLTNAGTQLFINAEFTLYIMIQRLGDGTGSTDSALGFSKPGFFNQNGTALKVGDTISNRVTMGNSAVGTYVQVDTTNPDPHFYIQRKEGSTQSFSGYKDGVLVGTASNSNTYDSDRNYIGGWNNSFLNGYMFEILVYSVAHSPSQINYNSSYLKGKYKL